MKPITIKFNPTVFKEKEMVEYFKKETGLYDAVVDSLKVFQTPSGFTYAVLELDVDEQRVSCNSLPLTRKAKGEEEELWGYPILRSMLGVVGKTQLTSVVQKEGTKEFLLFKGAKGIKAKVMLQREYSTYEKDDKVNAVIKYNINRFFNNEGYTATELIKLQNGAEPFEPKAIVSTQKLVKDKYKDCTKEEWEAISNSKSSSQSQGSHDESELPTDDSTLPTDDDSLPTDDIDSTDITDDALNADSDVPAAPIAEEDDLLVDLDNLGIGI